MMHFLSFFSVLSYFHNKKYLKIAHRGYWYNKKLQNTIESFKNAIEKKFNMIELDIQLCKSGEIVVYHDLYIENKFIKDIDLEDLPDYVPTIDNVIQNINVKEIPLYLDLKGDTYLSNKLYNYLVPKHIDLLDNLYIASFNTYHLEIFKESPYNFKLGFITQNCLQYNELKPILKDLNFICVHWSMLNKDFVHNCNLLNVKVFTYTCKDDIIHNSIKEYDIDGIVSDIILNDD